MSFVAGLKIGTPIYIGKWHAVAVSTSYASAVSKVLPLWVLFLTCAKVTRGFSVL